MDRDSFLTELASVISWRFVLPVLVCFVGCASESTAGGGDHEEDTVHPMVGASRPQSSSGLDMRPIRFTVTSSQLGGELPAAASYQVYEPAGPGTPMPRLAIEAYRDGLRVLGLTVQDEADGAPTGDFVVGPKAEAEWRSVTSPEQNLVATAGSVGIETADGGLMNGTFSVSFGSTMAEGRFAGAWNLECNTVLVIDEDSDAKPPGSGQVRDPQWGRDAELKTEFCARMAMILRPPQN